MAMRMPMNGGLEDLRSHLGQQELLRRFSEIGLEAALRAPRRGSIVVDVAARQMMPLDLVAVIISGSFSLRGALRVRLASRGHRRQVLTDANALNAMQKRHTTHCLRGRNMMWELLICIRGWRTICQLRHRNKLLKWDRTKVVERHGDLL